MTVETRAARPALHLALWVVQALLCLTFVGGAAWKLLTPIPELAAKMPWAGQVSPSFLRGTALVDLAGGLGILLPSVTRIQPRLTVLAGIGCALLMVLAIVFHVSRGEVANTPFNFVMLALATFVAWGRWRRAPIVPR